jgi:Toprim domain
LLYHLPELLKRNSETVFICEGEKDADALTELGLLATCNPMGVGKWRDDYAQALHGRNVVVITDNDPATDEHGQLHCKGQKHAGVAAESLLQHECEVRILELPRGKDVSEWLADGGTLEELQELLGRCPTITANGLKTWRARWNFAAPAHCFGGWPEPLPLQSALPPVETFSSDFLPVSFRSLVADVSERMQVPMDFPAVITVLSLAGTVNRRVTIQPRARDTGWVVVPNLWGASSLRLG